MGWEPAGPGLVEDLRQGHYFRVPRRWPRRLEVLGEDLWPGRRAPLFACRLPRPALRAGP